MGNAYPWCMVFVQWVFAQVGVKLPLQTASCGALMRAAQAAGCWVTRDFQPGDVVIYNFPGGADTDHCGIVEMELPDYGVQAVEGNTSQSGSQSNGGMVCRKSRPRKYIVGAVRPQFEPEKEDGMDKETFKKMFLEMRRELQDNDSAAYSQEAREWVVKTGLIQGGGKMPDGSDNYMWEDLMTREQMATLLFRFAKMVGVV
ncbi:MAG: CHAP domain-containing protein [Oscillospiraceae bacterium]|nr:CHAP domain-containing protein [Oscillospiraceae bacterium]